MITPWTIYWITRLDAVNGFLFVLAAILAITAFGSIVGFFSNQDDLLWGVKRLQDNPDSEIVQKWVNSNKEHSKLLRRIIKISIPAGILAVLLFVAAPTSKQAAAIYLIPKIANNEQLQQIPDNAMKLLNAKLQEWIGDVAGKGGEKK